MPKFSADSISKVEYDFRGFTDEDGNTIDDAGVVPEPSRKLVNGTMKKITAAFDALGVKDVQENPEAIADAMSQVKDDDEDMFENMSQAVLIAMAELCGNKPVYQTPDAPRDDEILSWQDTGHPTFTSLNKLDYRPFMGFFGYVMGEMMNPEASNPGTTRSSGTTQVRSLRSV